MSKSAALTKLLLILYILKNPLTTLKSCQILCSSKRVQLYYIFYKFINLTINTNFMDVNL
jgi:hypothetical protein